MTPKAGHTFTAGPATVLRSKRPSDGEYDFAVNCEGAPVVAEAFGRAADREGSILPAEANAHLIAEAFTVAHETGLTPRQLADAYTALRDGGRTAIEAWKAERAELVTAARLALSEAESWIHDQLDGTSSLDRALKKLEPVRALLAKATAGGA